MRMGSVGERPDKFGHSIDSCHTSPAFSRSSSAEPFRTSEIPLAIEATGVLVDKPSFASLPEFDTYTIRVSALGVNVVQPLASKPVPTGLLYVIVVIHSSRASSYLPHAAVGPTTSGGI